MATKKSPSKMVEPALAYATGSFAKLVQAQALTLKIETAPAFEFSEQTRAALDEAYAKPTLENLGVACGLAAAELEGKPSLGEVVKTLSLAIAAPAPGARGAGNVVYPAFGTGLAASVGESGPRADLMSFSSREHVLAGEAAPLEAWQKGASEESVGPGAHWIEKNALRSLKIAEMGGGDYLSARWPEMSLELSGDGLASLEQLVSPEALDEDAKNIKGKRSDSSWSLGSGRRALGKVLAAQRDLMSALEGAPKGGKGVFAMAAQAWADRKGKEVFERDKAKLRDSSALSDSLLCVTDMGRAAVESVSAGLWGQPTAAEAERLERMQRWLAVELPQWKDLPMGSDELWPAEAADKFKKEMVRGDFLADGKAALEGGADAMSEAGGWGAMFNFVAASAYATLFPPTKAQGVRDIEEATTALEGMDEQLDELAGDFGAEGRAIAEELSDALWDVMSALDSKRDCRLAPRVKKAADVEGKSGGGKSLAWKGIEELLGLADQCLLAAAEVAKERELAALESMGLGASAELARSDETGSKASLGAMAAKEARRRAASHADPLTRALSLHGQMFWDDDEGTPLEYAARAHGSRSGSKAEMEAFFKSPMGEVYAEALEALSDAGVDASEEARALAFYQACLQEFRDPSTEPHPLSERPMSAETKKTMLSFLRAEGKEEALREETAQWLADLQEPGPSGAWGRVLAWLGPDEGLAFVSARTQEAERQCPRAARWLIEGVLGLAPRDPKPEPMDDRPLKKGDYPYFSLPYGYEPDAKLRSRGVAAISEAGDFEDAAVAAILRQEGFAGEAALAARLCYGEIETRPGADDRSRANAWLAAGKRLCKEEIGMTEGAYQAARAHEAAGKRVASLFPRIVKSKLALRERARELEQAAALESGPELAQTARKALRLSGLFATALSRSMDPSRAYVVAEAIEPGKASSGELDLTSDYLERAFEPMSSGLSRSETLAALRREMKAREALSERFDAALLERADELLKASAGPKKKTAAATERSAIETLRGDLERVNDWAEDNAGAFFTRLNPKVCWSHLRRGEEQWHQEVIVREASSDQGWEPALGNWSDPSGQWTAEELLSPQALAAEGNAMRHCVGSYSSYCRNGASRIFSIKKNGVRALTAQFESGSARSVNGTLEVAPSQWRLNQNKGPCNAEPTKEGKAITKALQERLQEAWSQRVEAKVKKTIESIGEVKSETPAGEFEVPGFNPDAALDLNKLRRRAGAATVPKAKAS